LVLELALNDLGLHRQLAGSVGGSVLVLLCSGILLVLELALDYLGLGATAGVLNPIDILITGSQDNLQLLLKYSPEMHLDPSVCMTTPLKVEEYP
jgi:hypothetical protein